MIKGENKVTELEWFQAMIGEALANLVSDYKYAGAVESLSFNQIDALATRVVVSFQDMMEIRDLWWIT